MPDDYTLYAWARILCTPAVSLRRLTRVDLLGDLELIPTGPNYADTMKGIQALTNYLISVKLPTGALAAGVRVSSASLVFVFFRLPGLDSST